MKAIKICFFFFLICINIYSQNKGKYAYVDELQEFSATTWILAECEEYNKGIYKPYYHDIQKEFKAYKNHPIMNFIKKMREAPDSVDVISYNSLPTATWLLYIDGGHLKVNPNIDIENYFNKNDPRWNKDDFLEYVRLLDDFYVKSKYSLFFKEHLNLYNKYLKCVETQLEPLLSDSLFMSIYGVNLPDVSLCISPAYGLNNFSSPSIEIQKELGFKSFCYNPIIGVNCSPKEMNKNNIIKTGIILHEISHSFTSPIFQRYKDDFIKIGRKIYPYVKDKVYKAGYDADALCNEFFNTIMTIVYMKKLGLNDYLISFEIASGGYKGYVWIDETVNFMSEFINNPNKYPTIWEFMPAFLDHMYSIIAKRPHIVSVTPEIGSIINDNIDEIKIVFSEPMADLYATQLLSNYNSIWPKSKKGLRKYNLSPDEIIKFENDTTLILKVCVPLESGKSYGIGIDTSVLYSKSNKYMSVGNNIKDIYFIMK